APIKVEEFEPIKQWWDNRVENELAWRVDFTKVLEDAKAKAKPHNENAEKATAEAQKIKQQIADEKGKLKDEGKNGNSDKEKEKLQKKIAKLETAQTEAETKARIEKQTAESIYYSAFELDIKNPHQTEEESHNPEHLLKKLNIAENDKKEIQKNIEYEIRQINEDTLLLSNFERLTSKKFNIPVLKQTILQLAVKGELTNKWRAENQHLITETGAELLAKIKSEKEALIKAGKLKRQKPLPEIEEHEIPFEVPETWDWTRLGSISNKLHYGFNASAKPSVKDVRLLRITDIQNNKVDWESVPGCEYKKSDIEIYKLHENDILIARTGGTIGKSYLVKNISVVSLFASYLIRVVPNIQIFPEYLKLYIESPIYWQQLYDYAWGAGQPNVNGTNLNKLLVSIPPLAEQKVIVEKVEKLLSWCDALEEKIENSEQLNGLLMQTVVKEYA
ncbi:MAG: restriction endonuclease subunit S, partial [Bacteroidales bacterium]|nr:restriction endonuclease subunit S [Bacteroidales bacterium]